MTFFLGVDGGGSKTAALVTDGSGAELGRGLAGPSNPLRVGIEVAARNVERAVNAALVDAGIAIRQIEFAYCGIAGADHPEHRQAVVESLAVFFPHGNFTVDNDARIALTGAIGFDAGIVVISGTGSVAFGRNTGGLEARAGGWGPTLGDEGSGYSIARAGLSAIVRAYDGRGAATHMTALLCEEYKMCDPNDLPRFVYDAQTHADDIARYGRMVIHAAQAGDTIAAAILADAGRELGRCALAVGRRLDMLSTNFRIAYVGGAFNAGELLLATMRETVNAAAPDAVLAAPLRSPVEGAAMLAMHAKPRV
jgi:N-acetylglucosamine kinase